ncbi:type 2 isopentenyl-diphosphate Delta-isomerase [Cellulomonas hominis]
MGSSRKDDHVRLVDAQHRPDRANDFDHVRLVHHALAGGDRAAVRLGVRGRALDWPVPLYINGMTGGSDRTAEINRDLAIAARETGIPIASGSLGTIFRDPSSIPSFRVLREANPGGIVMANVNPNVTPAQAREAVDLLGADALQLHLNAAQEIVMPEGDRDFSRWTDNVAAIIAAVDVPVIVKEVGFGMSRRSVADLADLGASAVDVSGRGGTDFAAVENARRAAGDYAYLVGWGQSAVECLLDAAPLRGRVDLLASGGVRSPLDVVRALALGATAVGVAGGFLHVLLAEGVEALVQRIRTWLDQVQDLMTLVGAAEPVALRRTDLLLTGPVREFCELRGIDAAAYARRSEA